MVLGSANKVLVKATLARHFSLSVNGREQLQKKVWDTIAKHRMHGSLLRFQQAPDNVLVHLYKTFTSKVSLALDKQSPKPRGQDRPWLKLAAG